MARRPKNRNASTAAIHRTYGALDVVDARDSLRLFPNRRDVEKAEKADPEHCALAACAKRTTRGGTALVLRTVAYVETADETGAHRVERFIMNKGTQDAVVSFDLEGVMPEGGFLLEAPPKHRTLEAERRRGIARRRHEAKEGIVGHAIEVAPAATKERIAKKRRREQLLKADGVRSGVGRVHFPVERT